MVTMASLCVAENKGEGDGAGAGEGSPQMGLGKMDGDFALMPGVLMGKELGLSKEQQKKVKSILESRADEMKKLHTRMEAIAKRQVELMGQDSPDEGAVMKGVDEVAGLRAQWAKLRVRQVLEIQKTLTPEQRARMRELTKERMAKRGPGDLRKVREPGKERDKPAAPPAVTSSVAPAGGCPAAPAVPKSE
jgi:Spy/CpxP family protein refolding chaperone